MTLFKKYFALTLLIFISLSNVAFSYDPLFEAEPIFIEDPFIYEDPYFVEDPYIDDWTLEYPLYLELVGDRNVVLKWDKYDEPDFLWYKIMHSQENGYPYYPIDPYLDYFEDPDKTKFVHEGAPFGDNYYVMCIITTDNRRGCSNSQYVWIEPFPEYEGPVVDNDPYIEGEYENFDEPEFDPEREKEKELLQMQKDEEIMKEKMDANNFQRGGLLKKLIEIAKNNLGLVLTILALILAASGFTFATRRKRQSISKHMNQIDDTYTEYKMKAKRCEAELYRLKDIIDDELKGGKLEDSAYQLLMNRIEGYMVDIQKQIVNEKFGGLPATLKEQMFQMMEDGEITENEMETLQKLVKRSELSASEQDSLLETMKEFKNQDEAMKKRGKKN